MRRERSAIRWYVRWFVLIVVLALGASACDEQEAKLDTGPQVQLKIGDATYIEPVYSYCWPQSDENIACDVNLAARAQPAQLVPVAPGEAVDFDIPDEPDPQAITVTLLDGLGGQTDLTATDAGAAYTAPSEPGQYRVQVDVQYANVNGSEAYVSYVFGLAVEGAVVAAAPSETPVEAPTEDATLDPTIAPTVAPTDIPTEQPTAEPTIEPTAAATETALPSPTVAPTLTPEEETTESIAETESAIEEADDVATDDEEPTAEVAGLAQVTEEATDDATETVTEEATEAPEPTASASATAEVTEAATEEVTEAATESAALTATEAATEPATEEATEAATTEPTSTVDAEATATIEATEEATAVVTEVATEAAVTEEAVTAEPDVTETAEATEVATDEPTDEPQETPAADGSLGSVPLLGNVRVVQDRSTVPLTNAEVTFSYQSADDPTRSRTVQTTTDATGQFAFEPSELFEDDTVVLTITAPGYATQEIELSGADAYSLPVLNLILLPLTAPTPEPTVQPTPTLVPVEPTPTAQPEAPPTAYPGGAPLLRFDYAGRGYEPLGFQLCEPDDAGALTECVQEPTGTAQRRRLSLMRGAAAQLLVAGDRPSRVHIEYLTDTGVKTGQPEERPGDNRTLLTITPEPGNYIMAVTVTWDNQQATYYFRVAVAG